MRRPTAGPSCRDPTARPGRAGVDRLAAVPVLAGLLAELFVVCGEEVVDLVGLAHVVQVIDTGGVRGRTDGCQPWVAYRRRREASEATRVVRRVAREMGFRQWPGTGDPEA